ncbi:MAG: Rnase Y domain-containing protein, partial [Paramuribaculum sp.]|nr:Rnase Y domain-containing protein [Paramuribaculum sp.]
MEIVYIIITALVALAIGAVAAVIIQRSLAASRAKIIIEEAAKEAEVIKKNKLLEAKEEEIRITSEAEKQAAQK